MRPFLCFACWLVLAIGPLQADTADEARKKLQGTWVASSAQREGKPAADVVGHRVTFTGNKFQISSKAGKLLYQGTFRIDPAKAPAHIDFEHTEGDLKGKAWKGVFSLDGDTLKICDNAPDITKDRPTGFRTTAGSGHVCVTLERGKP